jgi:ribosome-associated translation inhibitor RaiA
VHLPLLSSARFPPHVSMQVQHFEKGLSYNADELLLLAKKLGKLATYCRFLKDEGSSIRVEAERRDTKKDRDQVKVMMTVRLPKEIFRVESRKSQVLDAVDSCIEKLEEQVKRYKEMHTGRARAHMAKRRLRRVES